MNKKLSKRALNNRSRERAKLQAVHIQLQSQNDELRLVLKRLEIRMAELEISVRTMVSNFEDRVKEVADRVLDNLKEDPNVAERHSGTRRSSAGRLADQGLSAWRPVPGSFERPRR